MSATPAVVLIEGEAGIGKSRLVAELADRPELAGRRWLVGACRQIREPFPLGPFVEAVRGWGEQLAAAADTLSPVAGALRPLVPELAGVLPPRPEQLEDRMAERHQVFRGLVDVLAALGPAVVVVEDLHWADGQTLDFLSYLLAAPPASLAVLLTYRGEEVDPAVRAAAARLLPDVGRAQVALAPLDAAATGTLAAALLGIDRVSLEFAEHLRQRASGVPFVVQELVTLLRERGTLVRRGSGWLRRELDELDVPAGVREPVRERFARLDQATRSLVEAAAVAQAPVSVPVLAAMCQVPEAQVLTALDTALTAGLLVEQPAPATVGFRHVLASQAVYDDIPGPRRRELHLRAAAALRALAPAPLGQLARHLWHAGQLSEWVTVAEAAADQALAFGDQAEAARLCEDVLRHGRLDADQLGRLAVKLATWASFSPRARDMVGLLRELPDRDLPLTLRGELRLLVARLLRGIGGEITSRLSLLQSALPDLTERPELQVTALLDLGAQAPPDIPRSELRKWFHRAVAILPRVTDVAGAAALRGQTTAALLEVGDPAWRERYCQPIALTGARPQRHDLVFWYQAGWKAAYAGHYEVAGDALAAATAAVDVHRDRVLALGLRVATAVYDYVRGSWDGLAGEAADLIDEHSEFALTNLDVKVVAECLAMHRGERDDVRDRLAYVVERAEAEGSIDTLHLAMGALGPLVTADGETLPGVAYFQTMVASQAVLPYCFRALAAVTQNLVAVGDVAAARRIVRGCDAQAQEMDAPLAPAALYHARGLLAAAACRWVDAAMHFSAAAQQYERLRCPYETAQALEQQAAALFATGSAAAEAVLRAAISGYQRLDARCDLDRAAGTARRHGVSLPARHRGGTRGYGDELSPREREVAELAATGRTNREIAAALFLSTHTVNKHLSAALRKLGLRSRTALASHLARTGMGDGGRNG